MSRIDERWMAEAFTLAGKGVGLTRPNPPVGAVVVRGNRQVGAGWHRRCGGPHAERYALDEAGDQARGAALYVSLEPCSTTGRTSACIDAIIAAGIRRVVVSVPDPNPTHAGRGLRKLRARGIEVTSGIGRETGEALIEPFSRWVTTGLPFVTLKLACTLDGRLADRAGQSTWITGASARRRVHDLRRTVDGIMVGAATARADNPALIPRPARGRSPFRVIVSTDGKLPSALDLLCDTHAGRTIVAVTAACPARRRARLERHGTRVWTLPASGGGVDLHALMRALGAEGLLHILCEGGGELAASLACAGLVDEYQFFYAPCLLGGDARAAFAGKGWPLARAPRLRIVETCAFDKDLLIRARMA